MDKDPFFIGWFPVPRAQVRFLKAAATAILIACVTVGLLISARQRAPGLAAWDDAATADVEGVVYAAPYAMIRVNGDPVKTILLVDEGKFGAAQRVAAFDGQPVRITGTALHRDDRNMIELSPGDNAIRPTAIHDSTLRRLRRPDPIDRGVVTLAGEIVDSKCYLGAMRPGGGKTHKGCAVRCLSGGVPPLFVTRTADRRETFYLLTDENGGPIGKEFMSFVGEPVEATGHVERVDDVLKFRVAAAQIRRG